MNKAASENPLGLGLLIVGAIALATAAFLPLVEPTGAFSTVRANTLIQHGGWLLIGLAIAIAASGYRVSQGRRTERVVPIILCVIAAAIIVITANAKDVRTLYPIGPDGAPNTSQPGVVASLGVAIYVAGAGVAAALIGSLILAQSVKQRVPDASGAPALVEAATKKCPDCAETVLADAKVCKHCGYRFARAADGTGRSKPTSPQPQPPQPPATPHKTPQVKPRTNQPTSTNALRLGDRVKVVAPGDKNDGKTGKVIEVLDGGNVVVRFGGLRQYLWEYPFRPNQLKRLGSPTK
jgi:hypothetical protein